MSYIKKPLEELDVIDDFLMNAVATDPEVGEEFCRTILSVLLQKPIGKIRIVAQRTIPANTPLQRGIRMDVEVEEYIGEDEENAEVNIYDIEPHNRDNQFLPKRNRFYQAKIDGRYLKSGDVDFRKLPSLYVITITNYDPFGEGYMMYTIHNRCEEVPELIYDDGLQFIYFNTKGTKGGNAAIYNLLKYIQSSKVDNVSDVATQQLHQYVSRVKVQPETRLEYMRFDELMAYAQIEGRAIGMEEGRAEGRAEGILETRRNTIFELLEEYGEVPESLRDRINNETSEEILKGWVKMAVKIQSIDEFVLNMD